MSSSSQKMRISTLFGLTAAQYEVPKDESPVGDIRFTQRQIHIAKQAGYDTSAWKRDPDLEIDTVDNRGSNKWARNWPNPAGYTGPGLRIPYRIQTADYTDDKIANIRQYLTEMSGYINGCIDFYDDTDTQIYSTKYILIRNNKSQGQYDSGCWSSLGYTNPSTFQSINLGDNCVTRGTTQHEMMHAVGFLHEQSRPDRDDYIDVLFDNIIPGAHSQFNKMAETDWHDMSENYDLKSVMHYEGWAFLTQEAWDAGLSSIVYKGTTERVTNRSPLLSSSDIVQLATRYEDFCADTKASLVNSKIACDSNDPNGQYYLPGKECNGYADCFNDADESFDTCQDMGESLSGVLKLSL